jgi:hypothetical protein
MMFRRELLHQLEVSASNRLVVAIRRQAKNGIGITHARRSFAAVRTLIALGLL